MGTGGVTLFKKKTSLYGQFPENWR